MKTGFNYDAINNVGAAAGVEDAVGLSVINCLHHQLGWPLEKCEERTKMELDRVIPKAAFDGLGKVGWNLRGAKILDVGAGQGGTVLEALARGADAHGVEPGNEFRSVAQMRLQAAGHNVERILDAAGEKLPFPDNTFDYLISLQVMEHVPNPEPVFKEMYRVLKPNGQCYISCENYLSFHEPEYGVPWFPMLPKSLGSIYLRAMGRNPHFFQQYVHCSTYPQIWNLSRRAGFQNVTLQEKFDRLNDPQAKKSGFEKILNSSTGWMPGGWRNNFIASAAHLSLFWRTGVRVRLVKPSTGK